MKTPFFSVVVIACNVAQYLPKCLDSILGQTFDDFEILLGLEESKDATFKIAENYAAKNSQIRLYKGALSGSASRIRNWGIENALGKYILFIDGDDWIELESLAKFKSKIDEFGGLDLIPASATVFYENSLKGNYSEIILCGSYPDEVLSGFEYLQKICPINKLKTATWMSAYNAEFLKSAPSLRQPDGRRHQDDEWTPRVFCKAKRVAALKYAYYNYRVRQGSITTKLNPKSMQDVAKNIESYLDYWASNKLPDGLKKSFATWYCDHSYRFFNSHSSKGYSRRLRYECFKECIGAKKQFAVFKDMLSYSTKSKKILLPIYELARLGTVGFFFAELIFKFIYEPLIFGLWPILSKRGAKK